MDYEDTVTEIDLAGVLLELPEQAGGNEPDLWVEDWSTSMGSRLLRLFRAPKV